MTQKFYTWLLKIGVLLTFITPFFVFNNLLFPYITSKQFPFNLMIEAMMVLWVALIVKYPEYRPKKNVVTYGLLAFFLALTISALVGVDFNLSFFGNVERMLGVYHLYHFLALYFIVTTVFRTENDWLLLLGALVVSAGFEGIYATANFSVNNYGTLGNSSYISGQMIFGLFFALYLVYKHKNIGLRLLYGFLSIFMFTSFVNAGTRGAEAGLLVGVVVIGLVMALLNKNPKVKIYSLVPVVVVILLVVGIFTNKSASWVVNTKLFSRVSQISLETATLQTRIYSWKTAFKDLPNHPFFGTGYGNFAITFDKYLDPKFFSFEATYFDHAHNNLVDLMSTIGLVGLLAYLSIFPGVIFYFYRAYKAGRFTSFELAVVYGLLTAYFVQNIVLFDSFITYFALMIFFGLAYNVHFRGEFKESTDDWFNNQEMGALGVTFIVMCLLAWNYDIRPWKMLVRSIDAQIVMAQTRDISQAVDIYKEALSDQTVLNRQSRSSLLQMVMQAPDLMTKLDKVKAKQIYDYLISEGEKNLAYNPNDSFTHMLLGNVLVQAAGVMSQLGDQAAASQYSGMAMSEVEKAIATNPGRPSNYYAKAQIEMSRGQQAEALKTLEYAANLNPDYAEAACQYGRMLGFIKKGKLADQKIEKCLDLGGAHYFDQTTINDLLKKYDKAKDYKRLVKLYEYISTVQPKDAQVWATLADLYKQAGDKPNAIIAANQAATLDQNLRAGADKFIEGLK
jgi:O-antigen ligase/Flp pilus assembly protein TadD